MTIDPTLIVSVTAVVISLIALVRTRRKDEKDEKYKLLELKTEVRISASKLSSLLGELSVIYLQQLLNAENLETPTDYQLANIKRIKSNLLLTQEKRDNTNTAILKFRENLPDTFEDWQDMKVTFQSWSKDIESELSKELYSLELMK